MKWLSSLLFSKRNVTQNAAQQNHPTVENTPYKLIGGEQGVRALAERFYDIMSTDPQARDLLAIHPQPLDTIRQRFFEYLSGWMGGPPLFEQQYGHPRLRARHLPYAINETLRDQWMYCMHMALEDTVDNPALKDGLRQSFWQLATHMINQPSTPSQSRG
ncbi:group II truncated hemoglobin [Aestuariibacter halophilus]|uniref:Group II truncated hemoglobin n=1 Tax=Fluctibacter halophilus TaxID=226011 RepID=A0ABS8G8I7_9ALTE|nr:group II truncated hemoglobin [Aestuariibacter halophilus]MCC2616889.1 group II truncated hemoglobin [Aestuariibacter halophilus]